MLGARLCSLHAGSSCYFQETKLLNVFRAQVSVRQCNNIREQLFNLHLQLHLTRQTELGALHHIMQANLVIYPEKTPQMCEQSENLQV